MQLIDWSRRYRLPLRRFFRRRMARSTEYEDLEQEVFLRLAKRSALYEIRDIERYIFQSASNVLADWRRRQTSHAANAHDPLDEKLPDVGFNPERVLLGKDRLVSLVSALNRIPQRSQDVFRLYHFDQKTHAEIAIDLGIAVRTVEDHMARANALLIASLPEEAQ